MKKFMRDLKVATGSAPKTVDPEYDALATAVRDIDRAIRSYNSAVSRIKLAARNAVQAVESAAKAFEVLTSFPDSRDSAKGIATAFHEASRTATNTALPEYVKALDYEVPAPLKDLTVKVEELKKLEASRNRVMAEYDTYREEVSQKEKDYERKGKNLSESKGYAEDVRMRDEFFKQYETENGKFKEDANNMKEAHFECFLDTIKALASNTSKFFAVINDSVAEANATAKKAAV